VFSLQAHVQCTLRHSGPYHAPPDESTGFVQASIDELPAACARGALAGEVEVLLELTRPERVVVGKIPVALIKSRPELETRGAHLKNRLVHPSRRRSGIGKVGKTESRRTSTGKSASMVEGEDGMSSVRRASD
jgi:hypothetical protein